VQQPIPISNEAEFQRWLVLVLQAEQQRLRQELIVREAPLAAILQKSVTEQQPCAA